MVQKHLLTTSNRGDVITKANAALAAKSFLKKYPNVVRRIDLDSSVQARNLFVQMSFVQQKLNSTKAEILEKAHKEIVYQFHYETVSEVEWYSIP